MNTSRCRSCGSPILWRRHHSTGNPMPLDADPVMDGSFVLVGADEYQAAEPATAELTYVSHFATCPQSRTWRKQKPYTGGVVR